MQRYWFIKSIINPFAFIMSLLRNALVKKLAFFLFRIVKTA